MPITLRVLDQRGPHASPGLEDAVLVSFDRPGRVEIAVRADRLLVHVYEGAVVDEDQPPVLAYEPEHTDLAPGDHVAA